MYEKGNVYLAEAAQFLQRFIQFEIPSLRRQISRLEHDIEDAGRKELEYERLAADSIRQYERELTRWKINGADLKAELSELAFRELPVFTKSTFTELKQLKRPVEYYVEFKNHLGRISTRTANAHLQEQLLPMLHLLLASEEPPLVYEWVYGNKPEEVERPELTVDKKSRNVEDEIDFGDEGEIDFGITVEGSGEEEQKEVTSQTSKVARGEEAISILESRKTQSILSTELAELHAFLAFRKIDEFNENPSDVYLSGTCELPKKLSATATTLDEWIKSTARIVLSLNEPKIRHLMKVWTLPAYVDELVGKISEKQRLHGKYLKFKVLSHERQEKLSREIQSAQEMLPSLIDAAKYLQEKIEMDISKRYNNREVYIMGEINAVLYQ